MDSTARHSRLCAEAAPKAGVLLEGLICIEIVYYTFQLWKGWHNGTCTLKSTAEVMQSPGFRRRANRKTRRVYRYKDVPYDQTQVDLLTGHMIEYTLSIDSAEVTTCCSSVDVPTELASIPE